MKFGIITLFPDMFAALHVGITGRALKNKLISMTCWNPRDFTTDPHRTVDDKPYGGGPGMVMRPEPLAKAIDTAKAALGPNTHTIYLSPQGKPLTQSDCPKLLAHDALLFIAGRYEGIDERIIQSRIDSEWSIGDYVLTGGELPAMVIIDALTRLLPGALGSQDSAAQDSFQGNLLDHPHYTRPEQFEGAAVPSVLLSGDHQAIAAWRKNEAIVRTKIKRPDLLKK